MKRIVKKAIIVLVSVALFQQRSLPDLKQVVVAGDSEKQLARALDKKVPVDTRDKQQRTPLHWAAIWAHADQVELLLSKGADVMAKDYQGNTPLHFAVRYNTNVLDRMRTISKLLFYGADIYDQNTAGYSPIDLSYDYLFLRILLDFGVPGVLI